MELYGRPDVNVTRISWAPMQARVLEFDWIVPADHALAHPWDDYPNVKYTSPELGLIFKGAAIEPTRQYKAGETIHFSCSDVWRKWERTTARLICNDTIPPYGEPGTSKIRIREGTFVQDALNTILASHTADIPGGMSFALPDVTDPPNADAPETVNDRGEFSRLNTYAVHDVVSYRGKSYIAIIAQAAFGEVPEWGTGWELYYAFAPEPHAPILYMQQDKTGQKIATWIHDIVDQTDNGIALIDYTTGGSPRLKVYDYTAPTAVALTIGNFDIINPDGIHPLLMNGDIKLSLNNKYKSIIVEGGGKYSRKIGVAIEPTFCGSELLPGDNLAFNYRFYFPESNVISAFLQANNIVNNGIFYHFQITSHPSGAAHTVDTGWVWSYALYKDTDEFCSDGSLNPNFQHFYVPFTFITTPDDTSGPTFALNEWRYTSYDGPLIVEKSSSNAALANAGDFPIHMPKWFNFTSAGFKIITRTVTVTDPETHGTTTETLTLYGDGYVIPIPGDKVNWIETVCNRDYTVPMKALANAYYDRYCKAPDNAGSLTVIIKGNTAGIQIGTPITNFGGARVQNIEINPSTQSMKVTISDQPIREFVYKQRDYLALRSEIYGNARKVYQPAEDEPNMPDITLDDHCTIIHANPGTPGVPPEIRPPHPV